MEGGGATVVSKNLLSCGSWRSRASSSHELFGVILTNEVACNSAPFSFNSDSCIFHTFIELKMFVCLILVCDLFVP